MLPQIIFWTLKVHLLGSRDILKNLTDFRKTVETGMYPRLRGVGKFGIIYQMN